MVNLINPVISIGSKQDFALRVEFAEDPDNGLGATAEESASWGSIELWLRGKNLCSHLEGPEVVDSVQWYLLPLIEWLARTWDPLLHEARLPNRGNADVDAWSSLRETRFPPDLYDDKAEDEWRVQWRRWWFRHSLQSCRAGGLFPDIVLRRYQDMLELSWGNSLPCGVPEDVVFAYNDGFERLNLKLVSERLYDLLQQAIKYLLTRLPSSQRLQQLNQIIEGIRHSSRDNRIAWLAGLGSLAEGAIENWHKVIAALRNGPREVVDYLLQTDGGDLVIEGSCHAALMFGSVSPNLIENDLTLLAEKLIELYSSGGENPELSRIAEPEPITFNVKNIWESGYSLAERVIDQLSLIGQTSESINLDIILHKLGIKLEQIDLSDTTIRGVSVAGPHHEPSILVNLSDPHNATEAGKRFTIAHELCHILFDRTYARKLAMVSGPWAPLQIEKRAGAFAAMLLMPREAVRSVVANLSGPISSEQDVHEIRKLFGTGFKATIEHLQNLEQLDPAIADRIEAEREERLTQQGCS